MSRGCKNQQTHKKRQSTWAGNWHLSYLDIYPCGFLRIWQDNFHIFSKATRTNILCLKKELFHNVRYSVREHMEYIDSVLSVEFPVNWEACLAKHRPTIHPKVSCDPMVSPQKPCSYLLPVPHHQIVYRPFREHAGLEELAPDFLRPLSPARAGWSPSRNFWVLFLPWKGSRDRTWNEHLLESMPLFSVYYWQVALLRPTPHSGIPPQYSGGCRSHVVAPPCSSLLMLQWATTNCHCNQNDTNVAPRHWGQIQY